MTTPMEDALKIIISKSTVATPHAMTCLRALATKSPVVQNRYNYVVEVAFHDQNAHFTPEERQAIVYALGASDSDTRDFMLRVRLNEDERIYLEDRASAAGQTLSEYVRQLIFDDRQRH